jgi:hypothetical protein
MTLGGERAHQIAMDMRDDRRDREGRPHPALAQYLAQRREPLVGAEQRLGRREVGGGNALRPRGNAQINGDRDAAAGAIRPADLGVREAPSRRRGFEPPALGSRMQCSQLRRGQPRQSCLSSDLRKADTAQEILKTRVGAERIEGWP